MQIAALLELCGLIAAVVCGGLAMSPLHSSLKPFVAARSSACVYGTFGLDPSGTRRFLF